MTKKAVSDSAGVMRNTDLGSVPWVFANSQVVICSRRSRRRWGTLAADCVGGRSSCLGQLEALSLHLQLVVGGASAGLFPLTASSAQPAIDTPPSSGPPAQSAALSAQPSRRLCGRRLPWGPYRAAAPAGPGTCAARERALPLLSRGRTGSRRPDGDSPPLPPGGKDPRAPSRAGWRRWPGRRREERYSPARTASPTA